MKKDIKFEVWNDEFEESVPDDEELLGSDVGLSVRTKNFFDRSTQVIQNSMRLRLSNLLFFSFKLLTTIFLMLIRALARSR